MEIILTKAGFFLRKRILLFMMKTFIFLCALSVFSFTPGNVISQNSKIKIESNQTLTVDEVFYLIMDQTDYKFIYEEGIFKNFPKVQVKKGIISTNKLLNESLANGNLNIILTQNNTILIKEATPVQQRQISGKVTDEKNVPLPGVTVLIKGTGRGTSTDFEGNYTITVPNPENVLVFSFIGFTTKEITAGNQTKINVVMAEDIATLREVEVVSTGYYKVPQERATGSFEHVGKEMFNRSPGPDVITRLKGITTGTIFGPVDVLPSYTSPTGNTIAGSRKVNSLRNIQIRGISTLTFATPLDAGTPGSLPLVILDNFAYEGDINNINPNDVESITVLKDAAAASIWGSRSSNGVIVITTKKGQADQPMRISFNTSVTVRERPDLFYGSAMSSSDYIDIEKYNFNKGTYDWMIGRFSMPISPVVDLLAQQRALPIGDVAGRAAIDTQIDAYRTYDRRKDISKYLYQNAVHQQYSMNLSGGGKQISYYFSAGYDHNTDNEVNVYSSRKNLRSSMTFKPLKNLDLTSEVYYTNNVYHAPSEFGGTGGHRVISRLPFEPYVRLADDQGNPVEVVNPRLSYIAPNAAYRRTAGNGRLLDWTYYPLNDIHTNYGESDAHEILMNFGANYKILPSLSAQINYQYSKNTDESTQFASRDSWVMRDFINSFATYSTTDLNAPATFQVPIGDGIAQQTISRISNMVRGQLNFDRVFNKVHEVNAIAGGERSEATLNGGPYVTRLMGYNSDPMTFTPIPYGQPLLTVNQYTNIIPVPIGLQTSYINRTTSVFMNASYSYDKRYTFTASARNDAANIFGITAANRVKPNWSIGGAWNISNEDFFKPGIIETLKLRATYGYLGNVTNTVTAYPTISYSSSPDFTTGLNYASVNAPPNPYLAPERSGIFNLGVDFRLKDNRFSGTLEWYNRRSIDLIAPTPMDISTGFTQLSMNSASMKTNGFEANLQSINLQSENFRWSSNLLFSYTRNVVTEYLLPIQDNSSNYVVFAGGYPAQNTFREGKDPFSLYTYRFAGLDPQTGDPLGYDENGDITSNYGDILSLKYKDLQNHGSFIPLYYGAFRNTVNWKSFSLSANILYKFKYKMKRATGDPYPSDLFSWNTKPYALYAERWQKPGDEVWTDVPSIRLGEPNSLRDRFYGSSAAGVFSGDHIRMEDIRIDYRIPKAGPVLSSLQIYCNINNLGILWRANKYGIDPDSFNQPPAPKAITLGINASF